MEDEDKDEVKNKQNEKQVIKKLLFYVNQKITIKTKRASVIHDYTVRVISNLI
jgi:hypothetical protein